MTQAQLDQPVASPDDPAVPADVSRLRMARRTGALLVCGLAASMVVAVSPAGAQVPNPGPSAPPGLEGPATTFLSWLKWTGLICGVVGFGMCGIMMMVGRRNRSTTAVDGASGIPWVPGGLTVMSFAAAITGAVLT